MTSVRVACQAMATRFELVLQGEEEGRLRAAGEEALAEIRRLEARLSFYRPASDIGRINAGAAAAPVAVDPEVFDLLLRARRFHEETAGAFDVTIAPLMRCWGFTGAGGGLPDPEALERARERVGMHLVELDERGRTVRFARPGVAVDLGGIGKGYAMEQAILLLRELGIDRALLHGGTSTVHALGRPLDAEGWRVAIEYPGPPANGDEGDLLAVVTLEDRSLSVSAVRGKSFTVEGREYGHVLDPRLGRPVEGALLAAVVSGSATETDALSTALLTLGLPGHAVLTGARRDLPVLVLGPERGGERYRAAARGIRVRRAPRLVAVDTLP